MDERKFSALCVALTEPNNYLQIRFRYAQVMRSDEGVLINCNDMDSLEHCFFISNVAESVYFAEIEKIHEIKKFSGVYVFKKIRWVCFAI